MTNRSGSTAISFAYVDVFAERPLSGNPLTVVPDADGLGVDQMRAIAREFNQSETTFVLRPSLPGATWRLRSFTPGGVEVGGAGHNALGAWLWLAQADRVGDAAGLRQEIAGEVMPVEVVAEPGGRVRVVMDQAAPSFAARIEGTDDTVALSAALGLSPDDLVGPAQVVSTGVGHLLIPVSGRAVVDSAAPESRALLALLRASGGEGAYVYTTAAGEDQANAYARFFNPTVGISEDPATGTAAGPLAARLVTEGVVRDGSRLVIAQGAALGRPSRILIDIDGTSVRISGSGLVVGEGTLWI
jgi:PhzF family phenazine biosynthesis protein